MKLKNITTPIGIAKYPSLNNPDTRFESQQAKGGEYHVDLRIPEKDARPLIEELTALLDEWVKKANAERKAEKKKPLAAFSPTPWQEEYEDGEPSGYWILKCKRGAEWKDRNGNVQKNKIQFFDASGAGIGKLEEVIGGGIKLRVAMTCRGWIAPIGIGIALDIRAVQIIELSSFGGGDTDFGFGSVDGGFVATEKDPEPFDDTADADF